MKMSGCWVEGDAVKLEMWAGLSLFFPQGCVKER